MSRGLPNLLRRVRALAAEGKVRFTLKALQELAGLGLDSADACDALQSLRTSDYVERVPSRGTGEWMYVFKPQVGGVLVYVKLILRDGCVVVSFHEDEDADDGQESR